MLGFSVTAIPAAVFAYLVIATGQATQATAQEIQIAGEPIQWRPIWEQLHPLFTHPRCINCHGMTNAETGENHDNGLAIRDSGLRCVECHSAFVDRPAGRALQPWTEIVTGLAPSFVKSDGSGAPKDPAEICQTVVNRMKEKNAGPGAVVDHVRDDALITLAYVGRRADAIPEEAPAE